MKISRSIKSPNFDAQQIAVEFIVLHYTACGLQNTLDIFRDPKSKVSAHIVLSGSGEIYEVVKCWDKEVYKAWHAGRSHWMEGRKKWQGFNDFSIGIEIVNNNGNFLPYNDKQYDALIRIIEHFKAIHPALSDPARIIGHEQIAGFRGKADPGWLFDWQRIYDSVYPDTSSPQRIPALPSELKEALGRLTEFAPAEERQRQGFWTSLNTLIETTVSLINARS